MKYKIKKHLFGDIITMISNYKKIWFIIIIGAFFLPRLLLGNIDGKWGKTLIAPTGTTRILGLTQNKFAPYSTYVPISIETDTGEIYQNTPEGWQLTHTNLAKSKQTSGSWFQGIIPLVLQRPHGEITDILYTHTDNHTENGTRVYFESYVYYLLMNDGTIQWWHTEDLMYVNAAYRIGGIFVLLFALLLIVTEYILEQKTVNTQLKNRLLSFSDKKRHRILMHIHITLSFLATIGICFFAPLLMIIIAPVDVFMSLTFILIAPSITFLSYISPFIALWVLHKRFENMYIEYGHTYSIKA